MKIRRLLVVLLTLSSPCALATTEIIQLNHRMADEMLPMARSVIGDDGRIHAHGNQLIVNAPAAQVQELRALLEQLDTPPRRLLITIDSSEARSGGQRGYAVDGSIDADSMEIQTGRGQIHGENRMRILNRSTDRQGDALQRIQATEGYPALIQSGQSVPLRSTQIGPYGQVYRETYYRDVTRGVYVTARISGEIVHITLSSSNEQLDPSRPGVIDVQQLETQVSGRLGEWIDLGTSSESRRSDRQGVLRQYSASTREELSLRLRVEVLE
ncbi:secretin N-terminal domain-containing protein [Azotobacter salinestris]|uniref:secretin N-terminal domain-containing protein n=1 Tax=Azotobacter salinestris TaxID=69964 RepID=UPI001266B393|nr:secretin N-terminal domain-containing protein [Azotobacter salinestris]